MSSGRKPRHTDWVAVRDTLSQLLSEPSTKMTHRIADLDVAMHNLMTEGRQVMVEGYFVYYDIGTPWYSNKPILSELLIVRVRPGGTLRDVARFLEVIAALYDLTHICIGTAFSRSDRALARLWQGMGYKQEGITLSKEI